MLFVIWLLFLSFTVLVSPAPLDVPLIDKVEAPLKAEIDISRLTREIKTLFNTELGRLKQDVDAYISDGLKRTEEQLSETNEATIISTVKQQFEPLKKQLGCQSGIASLGYTDPPDPAKSKTHGILFNPKFPETPAVTFGFITVDFDQSTNIRGKAIVEDLNPTGFTLKIISWSDTLAYETAVSWMACPKNN